MIDPNDPEILKDIEEMKRILQEAKFRGPCCARIDDVWYHVDKNGKILEILGDPLDAEESKKMDSLLIGDV